MVSSLIKNLKTLFHTFIHYKSDDETNYHNYIEKITYNGGVIRNSTDVTQTCEIFGYYVQNRRLAYRVTLTPHVKGQKIEVKSAYHTITVEVGDDEIIRVPGMVVSYGESVIFTVKPIIYKHKLYTGGIFNYIYTV